MKKSRYFPIFDRNGVFHVSNFQYKFLYNNYSYINERTNIEEEYIFQFSIERSRTFHSTFAQATQIFFHNNYSYVNEKESIPSNFRSNVTKFFIYTTFNTNVTSFTIIIQMINEKESKESIFCNFRSKVVEFSIYPTFNTNVTSSFTIIIRTWMKKSRYRIFQFSIEGSRIFHISNFQYKFFYNKWKSR